jgi:quercetin dioxygenase-like cupin family protein
MLISHKEGFRKDGLGDGGEGWGKMFHVPVPSGGTFLMACRIELEPGASIGYHRHKTDEEVYFILSGRGLYREEDEEQVVGAGDVILCRQGNSHGIKNIEGDKLVLAAAIASKEQ